MEVVNLYFDISIHAPREGGDLIVNTITKDCLTNFNPRPPRGGRPRKLCVCRIILLNFNPRPPRGGRLRGEVLRSNGEKFQSTPPARGATADIGLRMLSPRISIHAPREGGDRSHICVLHPIKRFQSTPPARGATQGCNGPCKDALAFQSTPPARGATSAATVRFAVG